MKLKLIFSAALAVALFSLPRAQAVSPSTTTNATDSVTALFGNPVIAKGKGVEVKQSDLDEVITAVKARAAAQGQTVPPDQLMQFQLMTLNDLIGTQLLLQQANAADKAEGDKKAGDQLAAFLKQSGSQEVFDRELKASGTTVDALRLKAAQHFTAAAALTRELGVSVTPDEVTQFYGDHPSDFEQSETVHVRHILLMTMDPTTRSPLADDQIKAKRKQIDDILKRARAGEDFAKLATQFSEDPDTKKNGGELPDFPRDAQGIPPELAAAAFSLNTNQISDVVTMDIGYDIIKLLDKTPSKKVALTDKLPGIDATVGDKIKDFLLQQKIEKQAPAYLDKLKKDADVEILDADLKAAMAASATNAPGAN
jgi:parvulin-like peptidyl-prolyl isomerase